MAKKIAKEKNGLYKVRVWATHLNEFGKRSSRQQKNIKTVAAANIIADRLQEELDTGYNNEELNFKQLSEIYLKSKINMSESTKASCKYITPVVLNYLGNVKIKNINTRIVQGYINFLSTQNNSHNQNQKIKRGTIQRHISFIKAVINWAVAQDILEYNRIKKLEYPQDEIEFEPTILTPVQIGEILKYIKQNYYNIYIPVLLDACLGLRRGESLGLTWDLIDFDNDLIYIKNNLIQANNKVILKSKLKTKKSKRIQVISPFLKQELLNHKNLFRSPTSELVCATIFNGETAKPSYVTKAFHKVILEQFKVNMRLHDLRHCFNHMANENNTDIITMINMLGHTNVKTNMLYAGFSVSKTKQAVNLINEEIQKGFA